MSGVENTAEQLRAAILARYPSIYAFAKARTGRISKSVIVQLVSGKYPGNVERQTARAWAALRETDSQPGSVTGILKILEQTTCSRCEYGKRACRKRRRLCRELWQTQATAIFIQLGEHHEHDPRHA